VTVKLRKNIEEKEN